MDLVLDGEILAWDNVKKETVPFGNNRTVAEMRRRWMRSEGHRFDQRDINLHEGDTESRTMTVDLYSNSKSRTEISVKSGEDVWLVFFAFDVVYLDGGEAKSFIKGTVSRECDPEPGSLIDLEYGERRKLLHRLMKPQEHEVRNFRY